MTALPRPRRHPTPRRAASPTVPEALTTDAWYTLLYISGSERRTLAARRRKIWAAPLRCAGLSQGETLRLLDRRSRWCRIVEATGRTPTVPEQLEQLRRWSHAPLRADGLPEQLDRALLRAKVLPAPGAVDALRALDAAGVPMAVVSNVLNESGSVARTVLDRLGVLARFRSVVLSCEHPWAKPSREPFRLACRFLGVAPARAVHLGDLAYDLRGAWAAGMPAWWYVGLRRYNRYLSAQVDPREVPIGATVRSWDAIPRRMLRR